MIVENSKKCECQPLAKKFTLLELVCQGLLCRLNVAVCASSSQVSVVYSLQLCFPVALLTLKYTQGYYKSSRVLLSMPLHFFVFATEISDGTPHVMFTSRPYPPFLPRLRKKL